VLGEDRSHATGSSRTRREALGAAPWEAPESQEVRKVELKVGDHVKVESQSTERPPRTGVIEEVIHGPPSPRYRIMWDDGHESIYTPSAGALHRAEPAG
jgi:Domain of unknown function (DUF1918)